MKNILSLLLPFAILISGCSQEELQNSQLDSLDGRIFTASFEQNETRTYIENGKLLRWNAGDQITIFDSNTLNQQYRFDGETGDNGGTFSKVSNSFGTGNDLNCHYAVYPYNKDIKITETGVITTNLPAEQSYAENSFGLGANTMVAVTKDVDDTFLKFRNVGGFLKLQLYGENLTIKSIILTGNNNEKLAGKATITPAYGQNPTVAMKDDATTSITLDCGEGVKIGSTEETATAFWIVVPPTTFEEGLTITVTEVNGESFTKSTSNVVVVERNIIKPMAAFEVEIGKIPNNQIWYTSSDGDVVTPYKTNVYSFGANIISNEYNNGMGIITFDGNVTSIGDFAFENCASLTSITIPDSVTTIGDYAFDDCSSLTSVTIGDSVTTIGKYAFYECTSLTSVTIPDSVTTIGRQAFYDCTSLTSVNIPDSVTTIGNRAFWCCTSLTSVAIGNSVTTFGDMAFYNCSSLTSVTIGDGVTTIGSYAFYHCTSLTSVNIPDSVTSIGDHAFAYCESLTSVNIPDSVTEIELSAFYYCSSLTSVTIPDSVTTIRGNAFEGCTCLASVTIPNSVTEIGYMTFYECTSLTSVTIGSGVTTIGDSAFDGCSSLTSVTIPDSVTTIGKSAFSDCTSLTSVNVGDSVTSIGVLAFHYCTSLKSVNIGDSVTTIGEWAFRECTSLTSVTIPDSVTTIGEWAFGYCDSLKSVTIGDSVTSIGDHAFYVCDSLKSVYCKATTPPALGGTYVFDNNGSGRKIYVPAGSVNAYKSATNWNEYASAIVGYDF